MSGIKVPINLALFADHPYLQIFGFLAEFVCGVGYSVVPLFTTSKHRDPRLGYVSFSLITTANLLSIAAVLIQGFANLLFPMASLAILLGATIFAYQIIELSYARSPKHATTTSHPLSEGEPFFSMAAISFVLASLVFMISLLYPRLFLSGSDLFSPGFLYVTLLGFAGSMIFGVELKTTVFRMTSYRKDFARSTVIIQGLSIALSFLSIFKGLSGYLVPLASITFLVSGICFGLSIRIFEGRRKSRTLLPVTRATPGAASHDAISSYSDACILTSVLWLILGCISGIAWLLFDYTNSAVRDSFIHTLAIGFIGSTLVAYGPVLLPGVLSGKAPKKDLHLYPLLLLSTGLVVRDAGNLYSLWSNALPVWESVSGLLVVVAMILLMKNMHFGK